MEAGMTELERAQAPSRNVTVRPRDARDQYQRAFGAPVPKVAADAKPKRRRVMRGSRPNAGIEQEYRERLERMVADMAKSVLFWTKAAYRQNEPATVRLAMDESEVMPIGLRPTQVDRNTTSDIRPLLSKAAGADRLGFMGDVHIREVPDIDRWHSHYDPDKDEIVIQAKFWREPPATRLQMLVHEMGHRGQQVAPKAYARFKRLHLATIHAFEDIANPVHLRDERAGHLHDLSEEVWAESYSRWCLGLAMPGKLREFWDGMAADMDERGLLRRGRYGAGYGADLAMDRKTAAEAITEAFSKLAKRWQKRFDEAAPKLARWFAQKASRRSDATLQRILRDGGFSVKFTMTPAAADIIDAAVAENVALIRSIPQQYLTQVEGAVMRSVRQGRDLGPLAQELRAQYGVTKRRAAFIALDQSNKCTADMTRARQVEKGYKAIWRHSHAGREPRPTHVANDGKPYDPAVGWLDPAINKRIWPGTEPRCRCYTQTVIPGFEP
jgi:hypothetical protein